MALDLVPVPTGFEPATAADWFVSRLTGEPLERDPARDATARYYRDSRRKLFIIVGSSDGGDGVTFGVYRAPDSSYPARCLCLTDREESLRAWLAANPTAR